VALQANGAIVAAGTVYFTAYNQYYPNGVSSSNFAVVRYLPSEPQIGAISSTSNPDGSTTLAATSITDGNPRSTIQQVAFFFFDGHGNKVSLGYGSWDGMGAWKLTVTPPAGTTLYAQAEDNCGVFGEPMSFDLLAA
jgi:hypothetical protein